MRDQAGRVLGEGKMGWLDLILVVGVKYLPLFSLSLTPL